MPVVNLRKILIVSHKSEKRSLLKKLQDESIVEIKPVSGKIETALQETDKINSNLIDAKRSLEILNDYKNLLGKASKSSKIIIKKSEYEHILSDNNFEEIVKNIIGADAEIKNIDSEIKEAGNKINYLKNWSAYIGSIEDVCKKDKYVISLAKVKAKKNEYNDFIQELKSIGASVEQIDFSNNIGYFLIAYLAASRKEIEGFVSEKNFYEEADFSSHKKGTVKENLENLGAYIEDKSKKKIPILDNLKDYIYKYEKPLVVYLDSLENNLEIANAINDGYSTESVDIYSAWADERKIKKVQDIISKFKFSKLLETEPDEGEEMPIVLENKRMVKPFEVIVNLYGVPRSFEIDPTPFMALFFAVFFGLCLTDAGYGVVLIVLSLVFAFKMKASKSFLTLITICGFFTIFAGVIFNGWFGDLPKYFGLDSFFLKFAIMGDPINTEAGAMNFFRLALVLGVVQVIFGLMIKFFDSLRKKEYKAAFFDSLTWLVIVSSLIILLLSSETAVGMQLVEAPIFSSAISRYIIWALLPAALAVIFFSAREEKSWGLRLFMGFLNLTIVNGITSYLGDILSYIRLMALGLVTAGIGVAINQISFQLSSIPVIGIVVTIIALIFGHTFNIGINVLGSFVHTMRLQYVEFFQKFYVGGGKPFNALKKEHNYITLVDD